MVSYQELIRFVWQSMRHQKWLFFVVFFLDATCALDSLLWPYLFRLVIDIFTQYEGDRAQAWDALRVPILGGICLVLYIEIAARTMGYLIAKGIPQLQAEIRMKMFEHIERHSPRYFNEKFAGSLSNKVSDMTTQIEVIIYQLFWPIVSSISMCLFGALFLWFVNPLFAWIFLAWIPVHVGICLAFAKSCDRYEVKHGEARSQLLGQIVDSFTNNFAVNLFYRFKHETERLAPYQKEEMETNIQSKRYVEKMRMVLSLFYFLFAVVGIYGSALYLWVHNLITTGEAVQVFATLWNLTMILWTVGSALPVFFQAWGNAKQAYSVMLDPSDIEDKPDAFRLKVSVGSIDFQNVTFHYGENKLFENKHVQIKGGERIGLVGYTGAGKSTFINLILRFFPLNDGKILIDGQDIQDVALESLREQVALIPQDPILFHRTLWENIAYSKPEASAAEILHAAKLAHADSLPGGYQARVGERGTKLSGGEKQRIAIARAILKDARILILDEATSSLDSLTEKYIQDSLDLLMQNRTTLVIAHRLSTLARMDRLLVFDKGKIVEEGSHNDLLKLDGLYAKMWKAQVGGFLPKE